MTNSRHLPNEALPLPGDVGALGNRINKATHSGHNQINNLISLKIVFALRDYKIYRQGIQSFYHIFHTFEECWKEQMVKDTPVGEILREVWTPAILRTDPLTEDLNFFYHGDSSKFHDPIMSKQIDFVDHIRKVAQEKPHVLLAYGHVMYLALFAGGRILRSNITKATGMFPQVEGLSFDEIALRGTNLFRFQVDDEDVLRVTYKTRYELATRNALSEQEKRDIIEEAIDIFSRNVDCITEIGQHNRDRVVKNLGYRVVRGAGVVLMALLLFFVLYLTRRILGVLL